MSFASRISTVHGSRVSSGDEEVSRAFGEAVASVEAELTEELDLLEVHDHVFDELESHLSKDLEFFSTLNFRIIFFSSSVNWDRLMTSTSTA
jgi:hypothetical protein